MGAGIAILSVRHFCQRVIKRHGRRLIRIDPSNCEVPTALDVDLLMSADSLVAITNVLG